MYLAAALPPSPVPHLKDASLLVGRAGYAAGLQALVQYGQQQSAVVARTQLQVCIKCPVWPCKAPPDCCAHQDA